MKQELQIIDERMVFEKQFRIYGTFEEPLFLAKDVANWIEHSNQRMMLQGVDEEEKQCVNNPYALKGQQEQWFLTEDGLYEVLMQSRKPIAKQFKKEVKEILKEIRKTGSYISKKDKLMLSVLNASSEEERLTAFSNYQIEYVKPLEKTIQIQAPKVSYYDTVLQSDSLVTVTDIAKDYGMSATKFNKLLNDLGVQYKKSKKWYLYAEYTKEGYTQSKTIVIENKEEETTFTKVYTCWTQKGRLFLYNLLKDNGIVPVVEMEMGNIIA